MGLRVAVIVGGRGKCVKLVATLIYRYFSCQQQTSWQGLLEVVVCAVGRSVLQILVLQRIYSLVLALLSTSRVALVRVVTMQLSINLFRKMIPEGLLLIFLDV